MRLDFGLLLMDIHNAARLPPCPFTSGENGIQCKDDGPRDAPSSLCRLLMVLLIIVVIPIVMIPILMAGRFVAITIVVSPDKAPR